MHLKRYKVPMHNRSLAPLVAGLALLCLLAPWGGARAAFDGYDGATPDIAYDTGAAVASTGGDASIAGATDPVWSPDATKIAYADTATGQITIAAPDGSGATAIATGTEPAWSPDGTQLAYVGGGGNIRVVDASGGSSRNLTHTTVPNADPAWSPDGGQIAFARKLASGVGDYAIFVMNASDGSGQTQLTTGIQNDRHPAWSPDGGTLAFDSDRDGNEQIYTMPSAGGNPTRVTNSSSNDQMPTFSPQGDLIAFARTGTGIVTVSPGGGTETTVASLATAENPDWKIFPPKNTAPPSISGPLQVGSTLTASQGAWIGARSFAYQWSRCSSASSCSAIAGATGSSYTLVSGDTGQRIQVAVTAHNTAGDSAAVASDLTGFVGGAGPLILTVPTITLGFGSLDNEPTIGFAVFGSIGTWQSNLPLTYKYQWRACERNNGPCHDILGANSTTFIITPDLVGRELIFAVTAHNSQGDTYIESNRTTAVTGLRPHSRGTPQIFGTNEVGQTLTVASGPWTGSGTFTFTFDWRRCDPFGNLPTCVSIPGATTTGLFSSSYVLRPADVGYTIRVYITARNTVGSEMIITNHTFPTLPKRKFVPQPTDPPAITGILHPGKRLAASVGSWTGDAPIAYQLVWRRCNATVTACVSLKEKRQIYVLTKRDLGHTFIVVVNATNGAGTTQATSAPTDTVSLTPKRRRGRRIVGTSRPNYLGGSAYDDVILGRGGNDTIKGGAGNDLLEGGAGDDVIDGGPGSDRIYGGPGSDTILAADGVKDVVDCGPGSDRVVADPDDVLRNCEAVTYVSSGSGSTAGP